MRAHREPGRLPAARPAQGSGPRDESWGGAATWLPGGSHRDFLCSWPPLPASALDSLGSGCTWLSGERLLGARRRQRLCWVHRGWARPYLSSFQRGKESVSRKLGSVPSGPSRKPPRAWEGLGLAHARLTQGVEERETHKQTRLPKDRPLAVTGGAPGPWGREGRTHAGGTWSFIPDAPSRQCRLENAVRSRRVHPKFWGHRGVSWL